MTVALLFVRCRLVTCECSFVFISLLSLTYPTVYFSRASLPFLEEEKQFECLIGPRVSYKYLESV
jgi:hypothetical protein